MFGKNKKKSEDVEEKKTEDEKKKSTQAGLKKGKGAPNNRIEYQSHKP